MTPTFWPGKKVFLTGHTGFKGGWLALWLHSLGAEVKGYALAPDTSPNLFQRLELDRLIESEIGDIRDAEALRASLQAFQPEIILHLAAQPLVRLSYQEPVATFETNVIGTANLLEATRSLASTQAMVVVTTDKCYENREWHWGYRESEPMGGHDPYSASKACTEILTSAYRRSFFNMTDADQRCRVATARAGNVIGGGDWSRDRLLPDIVNALAENRSVTIRSPNSIRPWQHVLEPLAGYMTLAERLCEGDDGVADAFNFGPDDAGAQPVQWIVDEMIRLWGQGSWTLDDAEQPHEATYLKLDCSKARNVLAWTPTWTLQESLAALVSWYQAAELGNDMRAHSLSDIDRFSKAAGIT